MDKKFTTAEVANALITSCGMGHVEMTRYILTNEDLLKGDNQLFAKQRGFILACEGGHLETIKYLVSEMDITPALEQYLHSQYNNNQLGNGVVLKLFERKNKKGKLSLVPKKSNESL